MNKEINRVIEGIEEKFTRCPECRSFSVKQTTELTFKERIKSVFVTVKVHRCDNCSYRFTEYGSFSAGIKHLFHSLTPNCARMFVVIAIPIAAAAVLVTVLLLAGSKEIEKEPGTKIKKSMQQVIPAEKPRQETPPVTPAIAGEIVLENSNRFGVNWRPLGEGVQITRLSDGSLKRAGLLVGDILVEVAGKKVVGKGIDLETARDDVFLGKRSEVLVKVLREGETLFFKIIKRKR